MTSSYLKIIFLLSAILIGVSLAEERKIEAETGLDEQIIRAKRYGGYYTYCCGGTAICAGGRKRRDIVENGDDATKIDRLKRYGYYSYSYVPQYYYYPSYSYMGGGGGYGW
uniref:Uncharacterized protein n=1 Tax=Acrobeloides nanus TaxID=290746 RepID=A0A914DW16_9BILA